MHPLPRSRCLLSLAFCAVLTSMFTATLRGEPVLVSYPQWSAHRFLEIRTLGGTRIAIGDVIQKVHGDRIASRVTFHFSDGSLDDDFTVFSQRRVFRLISDHHIQRGPSFPKPIDVFIDAATSTPPLLRFQWRTVRCPSH
jgi:hypothetical protein